MGIGLQASPAARVHAVPTGIGNHWQLATRNCARRQPLMTTLRQAHDGAARGQGMRPARASADVRNASYSVLLRAEDGRGSGGGAVSVTVVAGYGPAVRVTPESRAVFSTSRGVTRFALRYTARCAPW